MRPFERKTVPRIIRILLSRVRISVSTLHIVGSGFRQTPVHPTYMGVSENRGP